MKNLTLIYLLFFSTALLALPSTDSGDSEKMKTLYHCGVGTEQGFEGWKLSGLSSETKVYFENKHIEFFQHQAGNYSVGFEKRIEEMIGFNTLRISTELDAIENCRINHATAYVSKDGKNWCAFQQDARKGSEIQTEKMEFLFLKIVADITFYQGGRFRMNKASVFGNYTAKKSAPTYQLSSLAQEAGGLQRKPSIEEFFVFSFNRSITIETKNEETYEFVLSNLIGQVVLREKSCGSRRFETDLPDGIYFVSIIQNDKVLMTKKVVL